MTKLTLQNELQEVVSAMTEANEKRHAFIKRALFSISKSVKLTFGESIIERNENKYILAPLDLNAVMNSDKLEYLSLYGYKVSANGKRSSRLEMISSSLFIYKDGSYHPSRPELF